MREFHFEWDENKSKANLKKHGVSFDEAQTVFYDPNAVEFYDSEHSDEEDRFLMLGISHASHMLLVCHCLRNKNTLRIISARKATKNEAKHYGGGKL